MLLSHSPDPLDRENDREILKRLENVLDPELDGPIVDLGFVRSAQLDAGRAIVVLQLPTSWCAVNFAFMMAEDVRSALLAVEGVNEVTVRLGDHCAAEEIEAAVNGGRSFAQAFPGECGDSLDALRRNFWRKGFLARQERLLAALRSAGWSFAAISSLHLGDLAVAGETTVAQPSDGAPIAIGAANLLRRYVERRGELGLAGHSDTPLIIDPDGAPLPGERLELYYRSVQTVRVSLEANGLFCRAVLATRGKNG